MTDPWGVVGPGFPDVVATIFQAGNTIINAGGSFTYSGTPGPATLVLSIVGAGVTADPFGTPVKANGVTIYGPGGQKIFLGISPLTPFNSELAFFSGAPVEGQPGAMASSVTGAGAGEFLQVALEGPALNVAGFQDWFAIQLASSNQGGTTLAEILFNYVNNAQVASTILNINNLGLGLFNTAAPASAAGRAGIFASSGNLEYVSGGDGSTYATGLLSLDAAGQTVASSSTTLVNGLTVTVQPGNYIVQGHISYTGNQAAGTPSFRLEGPATSEVSVGFHFYPVGGAGGVTSSHWTALDVSATGPTLAAGGLVDFDFLGKIKFTSGGTFFLGALTSVNADTYTISATSFMNLSPC